MSNNVQIVYLPGLHESQIESQKAKFCRDKLGATIINIARNDDGSLMPPKHALAKVCHAVEGISGKVGLIGSSYGGHIAACASQVTNTPAVLLNPAIKPWESPLIPALLHGEKEATVKELIAQARDIDKGITRPHLIMPIVQTGDTTFDWRDTLRFYHNSTSIKYQGGEHYFEGFEKFIPLILWHLNGDSHG